MKACIITGAAGFIGRNLVQAMSRKGHRKIYALARCENQVTSMLKELEHVEVVYCDMKNISQLPERFAGMPSGSFIHLAWEGSAGPARSDYQIQLRNVMFSCDAMNTAIQLGCDRFLAAGTASERVIPQLQSLSAVSENMLYAIEKYNTHMMLDIISKSAALSFVWMQFANCYGPGNDSGNLMSYVFEMIAKGLEPRFGSCSEPYDFIYIDDLVRAIMMLEEGDPGEKEYFIGSGSPRILKDYISSIPKALGLDIQMGIEKRKDDGLRYKRQWFDTEAFRRDFGFCAEYSFEEGIKRTYEDNMVTDRLQ